MDHCENCGQDTVVPDVAVVGRAHGAPVLSVGTFCVNPACNIYVAHEVQE